MCIGMGCGISTDSAGGVLGNRVTQNGRAAAANNRHLQPESAAAIAAAKAKKELESDLNLDDPELEEAATRIQAAFRGHKTRESMKMAQEEEVIDIDLNDPEVSVAATRIQASFRGHQARKAAKVDKTEVELTEEMEKLQTNKEKEGGAAAEGEVDLSDPELNKAATKIQAQFRGHVVRKTKNSDDPSE